jgi:hypothetical protein
VFIVGLEPILDAYSAEDDRIGLTLYAPPGGQYALEQTFDPISGPWRFDSVITALDLRTELGTRVKEAAMEFFRAGSVPSNRLTIRRLGGQVVVEWPLDCPDCRLQQSLAVGAEAVWTDTPVTPTEVEGLNRVTLPLQSTALYFRLISP